MNSERPGALSKEIVGSLQTGRDGGPKDQINIRILQGPIRGIPEILFCRILMLMWSLGALRDEIPLSPLWTPWAPAMSRWASPSKLSRRVRAQQAVFQGQ